MQFKADIDASGNRCKNLVEPSILNTADAATVQFLKDNAILIDPRLTSTTSTTHTPDSSTTDVYYANSQNGAITFNAPAGSPSTGHRLVIGIEDNGTPR